MSSETEYSKLVVNGCFKLNAFIHYIIRPRTNDVTNENTNDVHNYVASMVNSLYLTYDNKPLSHEQKYEVIKHILNILV